MGRPFRAPWGGASGHYPKIPVATAHANIIAGLCAKQPGLPIVAACQRLAGSRTFCSEKCPFLPCAGRRSARRQWPCRCGRAGPHTLQETRYSRQSATATRLCCAWCLRVWCFSAPPSPVVLASDVRSCGPTAASSCRRTRTTTSIPRRGAGRLVALRHHYWHPSRSCPATGPCRSLASTCPCAQLASGAACVRHCSLGVHVRDTRI